MKLLCDCGNEMEFDLTDKETGEIGEETDFGIYAHKDINKFYFWSRHNQCGVTCEKCGESIWFYT